MPTNQAYRTSEEDVVIKESTGRVKKAASPLGRDSVLEIKIRVRLTWKNIIAKVAETTNCFGKITKPEKIILGGVSGYAEPGKVLAIIGSSGAGKSTLLNMLTWRNKSNLHMTGEILANGVSMGPDISKISAYVQQDDLFMSDVTVKEHLMFAAQLRFDSKIPDALKSERVQEVLDLMTLGRCENTMIVTGGANKTLSGGEKKRLSLATELLTNPSIMFFDEPTSGLDSYLAKMVVDSMKTVAKQGCTVICTIHQPSSEVFEIFDDLMILSMGRVVYHGEAAAAMQHYTDNGFPCPTNYNPADHYIMKISMIPGYEEESKERARKLIESFEQKLALKQTSQETNGSVTCRRPTIPLVKILNGNSKYKVGFYTQLNACLRRGVRMTYRSTIVRSRVIINLIQAALLALVFLRQYGRQYVSSEVTDIVSVLFMMCTSMSLNFYFGGVTCFSNEMGIFRREHFNRMYAVAPYFIAKNIVELPTALIVPFLYATIVYFVTGMYPGWQQYIIMCIFAILLVNTAISFSYLISCATPSYIIALAVSPAFLIPMIVFGGFFSNTGNNTVFLDWIKYLSWIYYINELLNINQWEKVGFLGCPQLAPPNSTLIDPKPGPCLFENGAAVLSTLNFQTSNYYRNIGLILTLLVGFRFLAFGFLLRKVRDSAR